MDFLYVKIILIAVFLVTGVVLLAMALKDFQPAQSAAQRDLPHANIALICSDKEISETVCRLVTFRQHKNKEKEVLPRVGHYAEFTSYDYHYCVMMYEDLDHYAKMQCSSSTRADGCILAICGEKLNKDETRDFLRITRLSGIESFATLLYLDNASNTASVQKELSVLKEQTGFVAPAPVVLSTNILKSKAADETLCEKLFRAIDETIKLHHDVDSSTMFFPIEDIFSIRDVGTIVTGRVERGSVRKGDTLEILGGASSRKAKVVGIEMFRRVLDVARAGDNVGINLGHIEASTLSPGMVLATPGVIKCRSKAAAELFIFDSVSSDMRKQLFKGEADCHIRKKEYGAKLEFASNIDESQPQHKVQLHLSPPAVVEEGTLCLLSSKGKLLALAAIR